MKKTIQVTLLSLLVFPGVGHLALKKYVLALGFFASFAYLLLSLINEISDKIHPLYTQILSGKVAIELSAIRQALIEQGALENAHLTTLSYLLVAIWLVAAVDAYRIANNKINHLADK